MRIRILELPTEHLGDDMTTPFAIVVDQCDDAVDNPALVKAIGDFTQACGARARFITDTTVDMPDELAAALTLGERR